MSFVPSYVLILFFLITVDFFLAKEIYKREGSHRKFFLIISICTNIGVLLLFKYFNFFNQNIDDLASFLHWNYSPMYLQIALPLGLSFHVFQSLSYVIEVYKKKYSPEKNYFTYALYVMFFPQLVAGPIERPQHLLPQLSNTYNAFDTTLARKGLERMLWGFFKKLVIADQLAQIINPLYANPPQDTYILILIAIMFSYQLYCDFSGYSDIAIGSAMMLGFNLTENFNRPFAAKSISDFWRRWHISLSSWLRDYLYYPLVFAFGAVSKIKLYVSLFVTFVLIGLWHGANWTFVVFGGLHGLYSIVELYTEKLRKKIVSFVRLDRVTTLHSTLQIATVFILVTISFIFFRSETVTQALWILKNIFITPSLNFNFEYIQATTTQYIGRVTLFVVCMAIVTMEIVQYIQSKRGTFYIFDNSQKVLRLGWYYYLMFIISMFGYFGEQAFIYFQF